MMCWLWEWGPRENCIFAWHKPNKQVSMKLTHKDSKCKRVNISDQKISEIRKNGEKKIPSLQLNGTKYTRHILNDENNWRWIKMWIGAFFLLFFFFSHHIIYTYTHWKLAMGDSDGSIVIVTKTNFTKSTIPVSMIHCVRCNCCN